MFMSYGSSLNNFVMFSLVTLIMFLIMSPYDNVLCIIAYLSYLLHFMY